MTQGYPEPLPPGPGPLGRAERWEVTTLHSGTGVRYALSCLLKRDGRKQWTSLMESPEYGEFDHAGKLVADLLAQLVERLR